jgi:hypothetical protein
MKLRNSSLVCILVCISFFACKKEVKRHPSGASSIPGTVRGIVKLYDESDEIMPNKEGVVVSIEGTSISFTTREDGRYTLTDIPAGTYNIKYSKKGFGCAIEQILITGNGILDMRFVDLHQVPIEEVSGIRFDGYDSLAAAYNFTISLKSGFSDSKLNVVLPFSIQPDVNMTNPDFKIQYELAPKVTATNFMNQVARVQLPKKYFSKYPRKIIFLKAFIATGEANIYDPISGLYYYSAFSEASPEISFKTF